MSDAKQKRSKQTVSVGSPATRKWNFFLEPFTAADTSVSCVVMEFSLDFSNSDFQKMRLHITFAWIYIRTFVYIYIHNHIIMSMINYMHTMRPILTTVLDSKTSDASNLRHARLSDKTRPNTTWLVPMRRRCPLWPPPFERCNGRVCGMQLILPWHELQKHEETRRVPAHPNGRRLQMGMQVASLLHLRLMEKAAEPFTI